MNSWISILSITSSREFPIGLDLTLSPANDFLWLWDLLVKGKFLYDDIFPVSWLVSGCFSFRIDSNFNDILWFSLGLSCSRELSFFYLRILTEAKLLIVSLKLEFFFIWLVPLPLINFKTDPPFDSSLENADSPSSSSKSLSSSSSCWF